jgi:hypothetical protein
MRSGDRDAVDARNDEAAMSAMRTAADVLVSPSHGLRAAADGKSILFPLAVATALSLVATAIFVPRLDFEHTVAEAIDKKAEAASKESNETTSQMTPHQHEEAVAQAAKAARLVAYASGALAPAAMAVAAAFVLFLAFRVAGSRPPFLPSLAVVGWSQLPRFLKGILAVPAAMRRTSIDPKDLERILPTSAAAFLPEGATGVHVGLLSALDLFSLWSLALAVLGMAHVAQVTRARAAAVVVVLWLAWVAVSSALSAGVTS